MKIHVLLSIAVLAVIGSNANAQESDALVKSLEKARRTTINGSVSISEEKPEDDSPFGGAFAGTQVQRVMMNGMGTGDSKPFEGKLEVHVSDGTIVAATLSGLPQIKIFQTGSMRLIHQTYSKSQYNADAAADALTQTFDFGGLIGEIKGANQVRVKDIEGQNNTASRLTPAISILK